VHFDPSIRLDNALTFAGLLISGALAWSSITHKVEGNEANALRLEKEFKEADKKIETVFMDRLNDQKAMIQNVSLTNATNITEIKAALVRIEEKLDRKADKPGR
jgi:hypothetical protein